MDIRKSVHTSHIMGAATRDKDDVLKTVISRVAYPTKSISGKSCIPVTTCERVLRALRKLSIPRTCYFSGFVIA